MCCIAQLKQEHGHEASGMRDDQHSMRSGGAQLKSHNLGRADIATAQGVVYYLAMSMYGSGHASQD
jgi:hypothetical protein